MIYHYNWLNLSIETPRFPSKICPVHFSWATDLNRPKHNSEHVVAMKKCCRFMNFWSWKIEKKVLESPGKVLEFFWAHGVRTLSSWLTVDFGGVKKNPDWMHRNVLSRDVICLSAWLGLVQVSLKCRTTLVQHECKWVTSWLVDV